MIPIFPLNQIICSYQVQIKEDKKQKVSVIKIPVNLFWLK